MSCVDPDKCGRPITGHPKAGWIKARVAGQKGGDRWWCSLQCLVTDLSGVGIAPRPDVARCPLCINRHDRDHRCGICGTQPQLTHAAPPPVRLYENAYRDTNTTRKEPA